MTGRSVFCHAALDAQIEAERGCHLLRANLAQMRAHLDERAILIRNAPIARCCQCQAAIPAGDPFCRWCEAEVERALAFDQLHDALSVLGSETVAREIGLMSQ